MENQAFTPLQWEDKYLEGLKEIVTSYTNYMDQVSANINAGVFYNTPMILEILHHIQQESNSLKNYAATVKWFTDRNLHRLEAYVTESQKGLDELIKAYTQIYNDDTATDKKINEMYDAQFKSERATFQSLLEAKRTIMDRTNAQFLAYIRR